MFFVKRFNLLFSANILKNFFSVYLIFISRILNCRREINRLWKSCGKLRLFHNPLFRPLNVVFSANAFKHHNSLKNKLLTRLKQNEAGMYYSVVY